MTTFPTTLAASDWTDRELLSRMLLRDGLAWREFHRRYDRLVYRCIHKVTSRFTAVLGSEDVREIYAQLLMNLTAHDMRKLRAFSFDRGNKLSSWIGMLTTNTAWDYLRRVARQPPASEMQEAEDIGSTTCSPYDQMVAHERMNLVNEALAAFSSKDRHFVHLYYVDGLSAEEVAERMQISVKTVYSKKHKIRCRLEEVLARTDDLQAA